MVLIEVNKIVYLPFFGAFLEGVGVTLQKKILRKHRINAHNYIVYGFLSIILVMIPLMFFFWDVKPEALELINLSVLLLIVIFSIIANLLVIYSLKKEDVSEIEPIRLMQPLFTILLAFVFGFFFEVYADEQNLSILLLSIIASISLVLAHVKKSHLNFNKYDIAAIIGSFLFAIELALSKFILHYYNSITFYFIRSLLIFLIVWFMFHPKITEIKSKTRWMILAGGLIWVIYRWIMYYGYATLGIVFTTMLFILSPIFIYLFAWLYLKEKVTWRQIISSIIIVGCIVVAIVING
jgi:drug/metabolite transporter (DMT)-like permease